MASTRLITPPCRSSSLHIKPCCKFQTSIFNPTCHSTISKHRDGYRFPGDRRLQYLSSTKIDHLVVYSTNSVEPGSPIPSGPSPNSPKSWILGLLLTILIPFLRNKWGPLFKLKEGVENALETAEHVTEAIEKVAEEVEKVAEEVAEELPEGGKLKNAFVFVENVAKKTAKDAQIGEEIIDKVEEIEKDVESLIEPVIDQANEITKEAADQKEGKQ
uniref:Uncharacterized protein n=1 Tax=Davidia involucrata TaxID=16924 RepID=A0A5B6YJ18_DAVIN